MVWSHSKSTFFFLSTFIFSLPLSAWAETVLLDFHSAMCGPCQQMRPVVRQLEAKGYQIRAVDIGREPQFAAKYGVTQVPTFIAVVNGREAGRIVGLTSQQQLEQMLGPASNGHAAVASVAQSTFATTPPTNDHLTPQAGRIVSIQEPTPPRRQPPLAANPMARVPVGPGASASGSPQTHNALVEATVKIVVEDAQGKSVGTGTIIDSRSGEALVLTCGHLFRASAGKGPITLTLFEMTSQGVQAGRVFTGRLIEYDLDRDLGLLSFRPSMPVKPVPVSGSSGRIPVGTAVVSVGCSAGNDPTARESRVTAFDRYSGPSNVEVAGAPVEGRSGGGLFNTQGELIGVCFAADKEDNEGLYASLISIRSKLDELGLQMVYQSPQSELASSEMHLAGEPQVSPRVDSSFEVRGQEPTAIASPNMGILAAEPKVELDPEERAALAEIQRRGTESEVICIIRPHDPKAKSEVITLNNASPEFIRELTRQPTSVGGQRATASAAATHLLR